jgi:hypothetical protein
MGQNWVSASELITSKETPWLRRAGNSSNVHLQNPVQHLNDQKKTMQIADPVIS